MQSPEGLKDSLFKLKKVANVFFFFFILNSYLQVVYCIAEKWMDLVLMYFPQMVLGVPRHGQWPLKIQKNRFKRDSI